MLPIRAWLSQTLPCWDLLASLHLGLYQEQLAWSSIHSYTSTNCTIYILRTVITYIVRMYCLEYGTVITTHTSRLLQFHRGHLDIVHSMSTRYTIMNGNKAKPPLYVCICIYICMCVCVCVWMYTFSGRYQIAENAWHSSDSTQRKTKATPSSVPSQWHPRLSMLLPCIDDCRQEPSSIRRLLSHILFLWYMGYTPTGS